MKFAERGWLKCSHHKNIEIAMWGNGYVNPHDSDGFTMFMYIKTPSCIRHIHTYLPVLPQLSCGKIEKWKAVPLDSDILKK